MAIGLSSCKKETHENVLRFATSPDYPPFESVENGELKGFDIDVAKAIAKHLNKEIEFEQIPFKSIINAVQTGNVDIAISTLTLTKERAEKVDFSDVYYKDKLAVVFKKDAPLASVEQLKEKTIAAQLGSTMEIWIKNHIPSAKIIAVNTNNQAIESLKSGHVDAAILDGIQSIEFCKKSDALHYAYIGESDDGYAMVLQKNSPLTLKINDALLSLQENGTLDHLKNKWINFKQ